MGSNVIINSIDVLEVMYDRKIITLEFYIEKMSLLLRKNVKFTVENQRKEYFRWMFRWLSSYFEKNKELKQIVLSFTEEIMIDYLRDANQKKTEEEIFVAKKLFSDGIYALPEEFREIILQNKILSNNFNLFYEKVVNLSSKVSIPIHIFDKWIFEIMEKPEDERLIFEYQGKSYCLWWVSKFPLYEDVHIVFGKSYKKEKIFQYFAYRLNHSHKIVRQAAYNLIEGYLTEEDKAMLPSLKSRRYQESSAKLSIAAQWNASYVESILRQSLKECLIGIHGVFFPSSLNYFKQIIENSRMFEGYSGALPVLSKECNDNIEMPIISNNPIRRLNSIAQMFRIKKPLDEIKAEVLNMLHVYQDEEFCCYEVYLLSLKMAWKNINTIESYEQETMEDKILWSYIWADILIKHLTALISDKEVEFSFEQFKVFLEQEMDFNSLIK